MSKSGLTLVELMVAAAVLSIGIVLVVRSFLTVAGALTAAQERVAAAQFLEARMQEMEQEARLHGSPRPDSQEKEVDLLGRRAIWTTEIAPIEEPSLAEALTAVTMSVAWAQDAAGPAAVLATYVASAP